MIEENLKTNTKIGVLNPEEPKSQTILRTEIETKPYSDESFTEEEKSDIADLKQWSGSEGNPTFKHYKDTIEPAVEATENIGEPCYVNVRINDDDRSKIYVNLVKVLHKYGIKEENIIWCPFTPSEARIYFHNDSAADMLLANMKPEEKYELKKSNIDAVVNVRAKLNATVSLYLVESKPRIEELKKQSGVDVINEDNGTVILTGDLHSISSARDILLKWKNRSFDQKALTNTIDKNDQGKGDMPGSDDQTDGGFQFKGKGDTNHDPKRMGESSFQSENRDSYPNDQPETKDAVRQSLKNNSHGQKETDESYSQTRMDGLNILNKNNSSNKQYKNDSQNINSKSITNTESGKVITQHQVKSEKPNNQFTKKTHEPEQMKPIDKNDGNERIKPGGNLQSVRPKEYNNVKQTTCDPKLDSHKRDLGKGNKAKRGHASSNEKFLFLDHNTNPTTTSEMDEENQSEEPISPSPDTIKELKCFPIVDDDSLMMTTKEGIKVYVYQGNLCYLNVQGIVNSSNEYMNHSSGLFSVIAKEAGEKMIDECQSFLADNTKLRQGKVCVTTAGDLKHYSYILHACAPIWAKRKDTESYIDGLMNVIRNALISADDTKLRSVAIPAIGSGGRGGPKQVCFSSFPRAIAQYRSKHGKTSSLKEVHFVDQDPEVVTLMQTAFLLALDESRRGKDSKLMKIPLKIKNTFLCYVGSESGPTRYQTLVLPNNVNVFLCDGPLFSVPRHRHGEKMSVKEDDTGIVITIDKFQTGKSRSASLCLQRCGNGFHWNYDGLKKLKKSIGESYETFGDKELKFGHVICPVMPTLTKKALVETSPAQLQFQSFFHQCCAKMFIKADNCGIEHLAVPVIVDDFYDYSEDWFLWSCTNIMMMELHNFAKTRENKSSITVHFATDKNENLYQICKTSLSSPESFGKTEKVQPVGKKKHTQESFV